MMKPGVPWNWEAMEAAAENDELLFAYEGFTVESSIDCAWCRKPLALGTIALWVQPIVGGETMGPGNMPVCIPCFKSDGGPYLGAACILPHKPGAPQ